MKKVFISYSYQDRSLVESLTKQLQKQDISVWFDKSEVGTAESVKKRIQAGIESSSTILVFLSKTALQSPWVKYELNSALIHSAINKGVKIIIVSLDGSRLTDPVSSAYSFIYYDLSSNDPVITARLIEKLKEENQGYSKAVSWNKLSHNLFEELIHELLLGEGFHFVKTPTTKDSGYDFVVSSQNVFGVNEKTLIVTKNSNQNISIETIRQLIGMSFIHQAKIHLITTSELTSSARNFIAQNQANISVWEGDQILSLLNKYPLLLNKYFAIKPVKSQKSVKIIDKELEETQRLIRELDTCPPGKKGWKQYENICIEILRSLFVPPLEEPKIQPRRESGIDIRDAIFPNRSETKNWNFMRNQYDAKYILFEFKNYADKGSNIDKASVLQTKDYLKKSIGRFGIICSRKPPVNSGLEKRKEAFTDDSKLILFLTNDHLKEMLERKYKKLDPSDILIDLIDDFSINY